MPSARCCASVLSVVMVAAALSVAPTGSAQESEPAWASGDLDGLRYRFRLAEGFERAADAYGSHWFRRRTAIDGRSPCTTGQDCFFLNLSLKVRDEVDSLEAAAERADRHTRRRAVERARTDHGFRIVSRGHQELAVTHYLRLSGDDALECKGHYAHRHSVPAPRRREAIRVFDAMCASLELDSTPP